MENAPYPMSLAVLVRNVPASNFGKAKFYMNDHSVRKAQRWQSPFKEQNL
jgi:hypothetical protein